MPARLAGTSSSDSPQNMTTVQPPIAPAIVRLGESARSKKHALDITSHYLAEAAGTLTANAAFESLLVRERLGCTALGNGVALPHGRTHGIESSLGVFLRLDKAIQFDAPDGDPVDLIFAVLVPQECEARETKHIARLAHWFGDPVHRVACRAAEDESELERLFGGDVASDWDSSAEPATVAK